MNQVRPLGRTCLYTIISTKTSLKSAYKAQHNEIFCIFARYEQEGIHICPTLGGALEAIPSQLQLTISVCLAVRIPIDFPPRGQSA